MVNVNPKLIDEVGNRFIGENYAVPSPESTTAIKKLAKAEGVFLGPVYTGKGFAGLLEHIRSGKIAPGSNVAATENGGRRERITPTKGGFWLAHRCDCHQSRTFHRS